MEQKFAGISFTLLAAIFIALACAQNNCEDRRADECNAILMNVVGRGLNEEETCTEIHKVIECLQNIVDECSRGDANRVPGTKEVLSNLNKAYARRCQGALAESKKDCDDRKIAECIALLEKNGGQDMREEDICPMIECAQNNFHECRDDDNTENTELMMTNLNTAYAQLCEGVPLDLESVADGLKPCLNENKDYVDECATDSLINAYAFLGNPTSVDTDVLKCAFNLVKRFCVAARVGEKCGKESRKVIEAQMSDLPPDVQEACSAQASVEQLATLVFDEKKK